MTADVTLTHAQAKALAVIAEAHPDSSLVVYPPTAGAIGVYAQEVDEFYVVNADGTPAMEGMAA